MAGLMGQTAWAQSPAAAGGSYQTPLTDAVHARETTGQVRATAPDSLPTLPTGPSALAKASTETLGLLAKAAVVRAAERSGTYQPTPPPSYPPLRPNLAVPEPGTARADCQSNGSLAWPGMCP
ncbi:hypothetical protein DVT68_09035 [Dyella solisilvae]|uniref:Uncharacterized protein n=2 Tax=Dyella solisilvae TaxID=1920168 RepID=A0A370K7M5_9GAMM|nr:hypothetical protein DVT68_09035 [Dyella solisilvae]